MLDLLNGEVIAYSVADKQGSIFALDTLSQLTSLPSTRIRQGLHIPDRHLQEAIKGTDITMSMPCKAMPTNNTFY